MLACDSAFTESITMRSDFDVYLDKLHKFGIFIAATTQEAILGYAILYANNPITKEAFIPLICVKEDYQGKGIGSLLMTDCYQTAIKSGMESINLQVLKTDCNQKRFYEKQGFIIVGETDNRYNMQKQLN